jgi:twitching motility protein PilJ
VQKLSPTSTTIRVGPGIEDGRVAQNASQNDPGLKGGFLENSRIAFKIMLIVGALVVGIVATALIGRQGLQLMRYHVGNLYEFMLVPITALKDAEVGLTAFELQAQALQNPQLSASRRAQLVKALEAADKRADSVFEQYGKDWITTVSPEFTATLTQWGRLDLQAEEVVTYKRIEQLHETADKILKSYFELAGRGQFDPTKLSAALDLYRQIQPELAKLIDINLEFAKLSNDDAVSGFKQANLWTLVAFAVSLLVGILLTVLIARSIARRLGELARTASELRDGNLETSANVRGNDEIGLVGSTLNDAVVQLHGFSVQQEQERQRNLALQNNIGEFLNVTMDISQGDLTKKGRVSDDILGNVVDAINLMTEEIGALLKDISGVADQVLQGSNQMTAVNEHIAQSTEGQARLAEQARSRAIEVTTSIRAMAQGAAQTAQAAQQTLQASQQGQVAVTETMTGMESVRREMMGLNEGVQNLAQRSGEIQSIVKTIANFASQTNLLALSAALEAAGAGESGRRFASVADQVRKLADDSTQATQQITALIKGFEADINVLSERAQGGAREVEQGYKVASQAGARLQEIARLAQQSAALVQGISSVTQQQVTNVEQVSRAAQVIASTAAQTGQESAKGRQAADELRQLSQQLTLNLSRFRLPEA